MAKCQSCGLGYDSEDWIEVVIPTPFWHKISPTKDDGGLLCFKCMRIRLSDLGYGIDKPPVPFRVYYHSQENRPMQSELYLGDNFDDDKKVQKEWDKQDW